MFKALYGALTLRFRFRQLEWIKLQCFPGACNTNDNFHRSVVFGYYELSTGNCESRKSTRKKFTIRLFANDVIMIGSVRADWLAPFSVTIGNPRADKLGRNGFECIRRRCLVDREGCVRATFMHSAIENYSMLHLQRWLECRGIKRFGTKSLFMIISHNCQSCMCRQ